MKKFTGIALLAAAAFAVTPAFAGDKDKDHACCATGAKMDSGSFANLNLSAEQKTKMDALVQKCNKAGCTKESMEAFMKSAETILNKEQLAAFKAECAKMHEKKDAKA
jgi:Spy/CpxP family protein refolding chaperone